MLIGVLQQKGGVSKSTTAVHLAHWLARRHHSVHLVDLDSQGTSSFWIQAADTIDVAHTFLPGEPDQVYDKVPEIQSTADYVIVDGPAGLTEPIRAVMLLADLVVIPCQPTAADIRSAADAVHLINQARMVRRNGSPDARLFISRATKGTKLLDEARSTLQRLDIPLLGTAITQRQCVADAFGQAVTVFEATTGPALESASEFHHLFTELLPDA